MTAAQFEWQNEPAACLCGPCNVEDFHWQWKSKCDLCQKWPQWMPHERWWWVEVSHHREVGPVTAASHRSVCAPNRDHLGRKENKIRTGNAKMNTFTGFIASYLMPRQLCKIHHSASLKRSFFSYRFKKNTVQELFILQACNCVYMCLTGKSAWHGEWRKGNNCHQWLHRCHLMSHDVVGANWIEKLQQCGTTVQPK